MPRIAKSADKPIKRSTTRNTTLEAPERKRRAFRRDQQARPAQILDAAFEVFSKEGFAAARVEDVAARAGVTKGLVYFYFGSKEKLFQAVVRDSVKPQAAPLSMSSARAPNVAVLLEQFLLFFYANVADNPRAQRLLRIMIGEGDRFPEIREFYYRELIAPVREFLEQLVRSGVRNGQMSRLLKYPQMIMGPALAFALWRTLFQEFSPVEPDAYAKEHVSFVLAALGIVPKQRRRIRKTK